MIITKKTFQRQLVDPGGNKRRQMKLSQWGKMLCLEGKENNMKIKTRVEEQKGNHGAENSADILPSCIPHLNVMVFYVTANDRQSERYALEEEADSMELSLKYGTMSKNPDWQHNAASVIVF